LPCSQTAELVLGGVSGDEAIYLTWEVNTSLPITSTWEIRYNGPPGYQPSPITACPNHPHLRLTGLTNYTIYTVTLNAILGNTPILTDTLALMPTDIWISLPLVLK